MDSVAAWIVWYVPVLRETGMVAAKLNQKKKVRPSKKKKRNYYAYAQEWDHLLSFSCLRHLSRDSDPTKESKYMPRSTETSIIPQES